MVSSRFQLRSTSNRFISFAQIVLHLLNGILLFFIRYFIPRIPKNIDEQTVLITGSGSGIGRLMAIKFAEKGCEKLILWDVNASGLEETRKQIIEKKLKPKIELYQIDLTDRDAVYATAKQCGPVDILVNNAGVVSGYHLLDTPDEKIQQTFAVNVFAHFWTIKSFLPGMIDRKRGHLVTIASAAGHAAAPKVVDYCSSKFANVGLDSSIRMELAQANLNQMIQTTIVKPYLIQTGMFEGTDSGLLPWLQPEAVADRIVYGVLTNEEEVVIPGYLVLLFWLCSVIPAKALIQLNAAAGAFEAMSNFVGRRDEKISESGNKISEKNNNNNNNEKKRGKNKKK